MPVGILLIWLAATRQVNYWDETERLLAAGMGVIVTLMFVALGLGIVRYNILGRPRVRIEPAGLRIGSDAISWAEIDEMASTSLYGVPFMIVSMRAEALGRLPLVDRFMMRLGPKAADGRRFVFITEQQLGDTVAGTPQHAAANVPDR